MLVIVSKGVVHGSTGYPPLEHCIDRHPAAVAGHLWRGGQFHDEAGTARNDCLALSSQLEGAGVGVD